MADLRGHAFSKEVINCLWSVLLLRKKAVQYPPDFFFFFFKEKQAAGLYIKQCDFNVTN